MATAASSPLASSVEKTNGAKLSRLLIDGGTTILRSVFDGYHPPANLAADLIANYSILHKLFSKKVLHKPQWDKLFPPGGAAPDSNTFDITLLFLLLTNTCGLSPPPSGWHTEPPPSDTSHEANLARVKFYRNVLYGHVTTTGVDTPTFSALWTEISAVLVGLGLDKAEVDRLKEEKGGEQDYHALLEWADSEEDIKSQLKNIQQLLTKQACCFKEVKEVVDSLKEEREMDRADEVFRKLAKSEFRGDIEYHLERYQAGTREWVFNRVQNWLDDRSSQNRVMVISGDAGMGKSVIAAVICEKMQAAGRLSGNHFCQHNNVRYRKPQLMLQSLACHLSRALPEYKQALVAQLSRNLGTELNTMNVEELFALLFKEPLSAVGDPGRNMLMVIDGLDECEYQGRNELLDVIANQFCKLPTWVRFVITTRPATNIANKLTHLNPFELQSNDEKNLEDVRTFFEKKLQLHVIRQENVDALLEKLVLKSEGLMLYAHFLILFIYENPSVLNQGDLDGSLPLKLSSVYSSNFKRLETELKEELDIKEKEFLNLLCAITAAREPLPVGFVSKVLAPGPNSTHANRKVLKALGSVSALLPIRDGCLHVIHKSVEDWLTDESCYGRHEFSLDEKEGHYILENLCAEELDDLKRKGVDDVQFSNTAKYALFYHVRHMLHSGLKREPRELEELTKAYVMDLEIVYAKTCVNSTTAAEDLLWLQKEEIFTVLAESSKGILEHLLFLLRKYLHRFTNNPRLFLQTMLNQGGKVLCAEASDLLQNKYPEIPYMEYVRKETQQGGVVARFKCSSAVACLDVSPQLEYMVCECNDGMLQLWSLRTGRLVWTRPVKVRKNCLHGILIPYRMLPSSSVESLYRSVVFHPTEQVVLPGILSHAYTFGGDLKPLFPESNCSFSVCSISSDKTKILTNCPNNAKCLTMWSLENGSEIAWINRNKDVLSFAWSRDGRLLAVSHCNGSICLLDVMDGFKTLAETTSPQVCGTLKFSPDSRCLFCSKGSESFLTRRLFRCDVNRGDHNTFSLDFSSDKVFYDHSKFESFNDCGFLLGDLISSAGFTALTFILNKQSLLSYFSNKVEMINEVITSSHSTAWQVALSLDGQTVYVVCWKSVKAWNVSSGELIAEKKLKLCLSNERALCPVRGGIVIKAGINTLELWNSDLSECVQRWCVFSGITEVIPISEERVACLEEESLSVLDTTSGKIVSTFPVSHGRIITCNSKCQLLTVARSDLLLLSAGTTVLWKNDSLLEKCFGETHAMFSPVEQFLVINISGLVFVLDAVSGNTLRMLDAKEKGFFCPRYLAFVSDEECVVGDYSSFTLFNVKSGDLLSVIDSDKVLCLAACPRKRLLAIGLGVTPNFKVLQVCLPRDKDSRRIKR